MNDKQLLTLQKDFGKAFYLLDSVQFRKNYKELAEAFSSIYPKFNIAYSYKTNYTPKLCKIVNELGGYAEVVSDMEMEIALRVGVKPEAIIWNGPIKNYEKVEHFLLDGGKVNLDSLYEVSLIKSIAEKYPHNRLNIGIRVNFEINDGVVSRFGFDVDSDEFKKVFELTKIHNIHLYGVQCHFATRRLDTWRPRAERMISIFDSLGIVPEIIDLGGGLFGKMDSSLQAQFESKIPTYEEYASEVAFLFVERYGRSNGPTLLLEPGSALVGDCMQFVTVVENVKDIRGKKIATVLGSIYNINPTLNKKNPPLRVVNSGAIQEYFEDLDFGGYTCIESDYIYRHYQGKLAVGDLLVFGNAGSYSVVLKPPFILPNFPILDTSEGKIEVLKHAETFDDIFHTFEF
nr:pyridoxal-dependent decarboxylase [uncultured Sphaerochaeta sp.]